MYCPNIASVCLRFSYCRIQLFQGIKDINGTSKRPNSLVVFVLLWWSRWKTLKQELHGKLRLKQLESTPFLWPLFRYVSSQHHNFLAKYCLKCAHFRPLESHPQLFQAPPWFPWRQVWLPPFNYLYFQSYHTYNNILRVTYEREETSHHQPSLVLLQCCAASNSYWLWWGFGGISHC